MNRSSLVRAVFLALTATLGLALHGCEASLVPGRELSSGLERRLASSPASYGHGEEKTTDVEAAALADLFEREMPAAARPRVRHDPALDKAAEVFALVRFDSDEPPVKSLAQWLFWKMGIEKPYLGAAFGVVYGRDLDAYLDAYAADVARHMDPREPTLSYGVARIAPGGYYKVQAVVFAAGSLEVGEIAKSHSPGSTLTISGHLLDPVTHPVAYITEDEKHVKEIPFEPDANGKVSFTTVLPKRPGRYFIDVVARDPAEVSPDPQNPWRSLLLWLPLYVGVPEPTSPDAFIGHPALNRATPREMAAQILDVYDAERARLGLGPLTRNTGLAEAAERRALFVAQSEGRVPPDPELPDTLTRLGLGRSSWQQQQTFLFAEEHAQMELLKPHHRAFLLAPTMVVGAGVAVRSKATRAEGEKREQGTSQSAGPQVFEVEEYYAISHQP